MIPIEIKNISKSYDRTKALDGVSFHVNNGEIFGLIGPDGAGKTTLFRILTTLLLPDEGDALVWGFDTVKDYRKIRRIVGYMPGRFSLYPDLSVEENLTFFATIFNTSIRKNYDLIKEIYQQLEPFKNRPAGKLSGGMKQKLALSCALIHKPRVLFLDEPTTGVDAVSRKEFWEILQRIKKQGISILLSTSYMDEAGQCDRVGLIQNGQLMRVDTPENIVSRFPYHLFAVSAADTYRLIGDLKDFAQSGTVFPFGDAVHFTSTDRELQPETLIAYLKDKAHSDITVKSIAPTIEDCFMDLMTTAKNTRK